MHSLALRNVLQGCAVSLPLSWLVSKGNCGCDGQGGALAPRGWLGIVPDQDWPGPHLAPLQEPHPGRVYSLADILRATAGVCAPCPGMGKMGPAHCLCGRGQQCSTSRQHSDFTQKTPAAWQHARDSGQPFLPGTEGGLGRPCGGQWLPAAGSLARPSWREGAPRVAPTVCPLSPGTLLPQGAGLSVGLGAGQGRGWGLLALESASCSRHPQSLRSWLTLSTAPQSTQGPPIACNQVGVERRGPLVHHHTDSHSPALVHKGEACKCRKTHNKPGGGGGREPAQAFLGWPAAELPPPLPHQHRGPSAGATLPTHPSALQLPSAGLAALQSPSRRMLSEADGCALAGVCPGGGDSGQPGWGASAPPPPTQAPQWECLPGGEGGRGGSGL